MFSVNSLSFFNAEQQHLYLLGARFDQNLNVALDSLHAVTLHIFFYKCSDLSNTSPLVCSFSLFLKHTFPSFIFKKKGAFIVSFLYILYINDLVNHVNDR